MNLREQTIKFIKTSETLYENYDKQYLYHATFKHYLSSIMKNGLGATKQIHYEDSVPGVVYLAKDPYEAKSYAECAEDIPEEWLDEIIILKINILYLDKTKLKIDKNNLSGTTLEYHKIIPPKAISIYKQ